FSRSFLIPLRPIFPSGHDDKGSANRRRYDTNGGLTRRDLLHDPKGLRANDQWHRSARASLISSSTKSGGVRAAICRAISPFSARLSLRSGFKPSTRMSRFALASSTSKTRQSESFFMGL